jgi:hypothetical protein
MSKSWKDGLLRSSLPLEQLVAEVLAKRKFYVCGEYSYLRKNENGIETEFSVDLEAFELLPEKGGSWGNLRLLVECKYNYPSVRWVFASHVNPENLVGGVIRCFDHLCTQTIDDERLVPFDHDLEYCVTGVELHENGEVNRQSITRATHQLRYAILASVLREAEIQIEEWNDVDLAAALYCPIIVTTSQLYVLNTGITLEMFQNANDIDEIATGVDSLVISKENGPQFDREITQDLSMLHSNYPDIKKRLLEIARIQGEDTKTLGPAFSFDHHIRFASQNVLVVNYKQLDHTIQKLRKVVMQAGRFRNRIGFLRRDMQARTKWIEPPAQKPN